MSEEKGTKCKICGRHLSDGRNEWGTGGVDFIKRLIDNEWIWICMLCDEKRE